MKNIIFLVTIFCLVQIVVTQVIIPEGCDNKLSNRRSIQALDSDGNVLYNFTDCGDLVTNLPELCDLYGGVGNFCCEACYDVDTSCLDTKLKHWIVDNDSYDCAGYADLSECNCADSVVAESCCASCTGKDLSGCGDPNCRDTLTSENPIQMTFGATNVNIDSCSKMAEDFSILCLQFGQPGSICCSSCKDILDLKCFDQLVAFGSMMCEEYVAADPCHCKQTVDNVKVAESCCKSCAAADQNQNCCKDRVSAENPLDVIDAVTGITTAVLTSCEQLVNHRALCEDKTISGELGRCCEWCENNKDANQCFDDPTVQITQDGQTYGCADFVALDDPCNCLLIPKAKKDCCMSCQGKNTSNCACRDLLSPENPLTFNQSSLVIESCDDLSPNYLDLCKELKGKGQACCQTCRSVNLRCVDNSQIQFTTPDQVKHNCASYIATDVCNCRLTDECCFSCSQANRSHCSCYDSISAIYPVTLTTETGEVIAEVTSCSEIISRYPDQCAQFDIGGNLNKRKGGRCCQSCQAVPDPSCVNNPLALFTVNGQPYNCEELIAFSKCFCEDQIDGVDVRATCCASCKPLRKELDDCRCRDILRQEIPSRISDQDGNFVENVTSCGDLVARYPEQCVSAAGRGGVCCQSCKAVPNPSCLDLLRSPIVLTPEIILTTCTDVVDQYPELCKQLSGPGNVCCRSCKPIRTECMDTRLREWTRAGKVYDCEGWVGVDPCQCELDSTVAESCCRSCRNANRELTKRNCSCRNYLHPDHGASITLVVGNVNIAVTSCTQVKNEYPWLCRQAGYQELCCAACSQIDTSCLDDNVGFNGATLTCNEFVEEDKCNCELTVSGIVVKEACCRTCRKKDTSNCGCRNTVTEDDPITFTDGSQITSCKTLKQNKYKKLCEMFGQPGGKCCDACKGVETTCVDDPLKIFFYQSDPFTKYKCHEWINEDRCHCHKPETKLDCCYSCLLVTTEGCACRDSVSAKHPIIARVTDVNTNVTSTQLITSCSDLSSRFPHKCPEFGGEGKECCQTCPDPCQDKPDYRIDLGKKCRDCSCSQVKPRLKLKRACCTNNKGFRDNCCATCKQFKC